MHEFNDEVEDLADEILAYALERLKKDPPLDGPKSPEELLAKAGNTITENGLGGKKTLDLVAGLKTDLKDTVLLDLSSCVLEDRHAFSYRRDGITGRQAGAIWL